MLIVFIFQKNRSLLRAPKFLPPTIIEFCPLIFSPFFSDSKNIPLYKKLWRPTYAATNVTTEQTSVQSTFTTT